MTCGDKCKCDCCKKKLKAKVKAPRRQAKPKVAPMKLVKIDTLPPIPWKSGMSSTSDIGREPVLKKSMTTQTERELHRELSPPLLVPRARRERGTMMTPITPDIISPTPPPIPSFTPGFEIPTPTLQRFTRAGRPSREERQQTREQGFRTISQLRRHEAQELLSQFGPPELGNYAFLPESR